MTKFILFANGVLAARYDLAIHGENIPDEAMAVDDEVFFQTISETDGQWALVDGQIVKQPFSPPVLVVASVVTMRQARLALLAGGLLDGVNAAVAQMPAAAQIEWEYATSVDRNSPLVAGLAGLLALDAVELDNLFSYAASV